MKSRRIKVDEFSSSGRSIWSIFVTLGTRGTPDQLRTNTLEQIHLFFFACVTTRAKFRLGDDATCERSNCRKSARYTPLPGHSKPSCDLETVVARSTCNRFLLGSLSSVQVVTRVRASPAHVCATGCAHTYARYACTGTCARVQAASRFRFH